MSGYELAALVCAAAALLMLAVVLLYRRVVLDARHEVRCLRAFYAVVLYERDDLQREAVWLRTDAAAARAVAEEQRRQHVDWAVWDRNTEPLTDEERDELRERFTRVLDGYDTHGGAR